VTATTTRVLADLALAVAIAAFALSIVLAALGAWCLRPRTARRDLDEMPGHPEYVQPIGDEDADEIFGDIAEQLLDDGLADFAEEQGWMR
jgi:hypothetical protein